MGNFNDFNLDIKTIRVNNDADNHECTSDTCSSQGCYTDICRPI